MAIEVIEENEPMEIDQVVMVLYGQPGIGKTSIAYSSRRPMLLDFDGGATGGAIRKGATRRIRSWSDIEGLEPDDLAQRDTLIVDTVGSLLRHRMYKMISEDPAMGSGSSKQAPSQRGWGKLGGDFNDWLEEMKLYGLDIVLLSHSTEVTVKDELAQRLQMPGKMAENIVYQAATQIGYIHPYPNTTARIQFSPTLATYGKDRAGIGHVDVPEISQFENYNFLRDLIETVRTNINERQKGFTFPDEDDEGKVVLTDALLRRLTETAQTLREQRDRKRQNAFAAQIERLGARWDSDTKSVVPVDYVEEKEDVVIVNPNTDETTTVEDEQDAEAEALQLEGQES